MSYYTSPIDADALLQQAADKFPLGTVVAWRGPRGHAEGGTVTGYDISSTGRVYLKVNSARLAWVPADECKHLAPEPEASDPDEDGKQHRAVITPADLADIICRDCGLTFYSCQCPICN